MVGPERAVAGGTARDLTRWLFPRDRPETILYLGGINLMLLQYVTVREFVAILSGYEVVIGLVFTAFFLGYSFGYLLSGRLDRGRLRRLALATFLLHTLLPFLPRVLVGFLFSRDLPSLALMGVLFLGTFAMASFYSVFLPLFAASWENQGGLGKAYAYEVTGSIVGIGCIVCLGRLGALVLMVAYLVVLLVIVHLVTRSSPARTGALSLLILVYIVSFPDLDRASTEYLYDTVHGFSDGRLVESALSPYQKIEVVSGRGGRRYLYLDGLLDYGSRELIAYDEHLADIPTRLLSDRLGKREANVLIVGGGTMKTMEYASGRARMVTVVEIDPVMGRISKERFLGEEATRNRLHWKLIHDDAKHFLVSNPDRYDLIVVDINTPLTIQEAVLHSVEFFKLLESRLTPAGFVSLGLSGTFKPDAYTPARIVAGLVAVFSEVMVVTPTTGGRSFAYAGSRLPFDVQALERMIRPREEEAWNEMMDKYRRRRKAGDPGAWKSRPPFGEPLRIQTTPEVRAQVDGIDPIGLDNMEIVLVRGMRRLAGRFLPGWRRR